MRATAVASAPGKLVLCGEYAVLDGAPAIAMAVSRRAHATVMRGPGDSIRVRAPGYTKIEGRLSCLGKKLDWQQGESEFALVAAVCNELRSRLDGCEQIELDTDSFVDVTTRKKLGIGSSAALTVALCAALQRSCDVFAVARRAHARLQGGLGSGVDIACASAGGLIEYRVAEHESTALQWPVELVFQVVWTGVAASTKARLARLQESARRPSREKLLAIAREMATLWRSGIAKDIIAGHREYNNELQAFSIDHDLGIFEGGHRELVAAAIKCNLAYKPCGAGGGDVGVVLGTDAVALDEFVKEQSRRCTPLDCTIDPLGVTISDGPEANE